MSKSRTLLTALLLTICLTGAIQGRRFVGSLTTTSGDRLAEQDGKLVLVRTQGAATRIEGLISSWKIGSPYVQTATGRFLAMNQTDQGQKFYLADKSSESAKWVIEVLESVSPQRPKNGSIGERSLVEGESRTKFRLSVFAGPSKGWYLAASELENEQSKTQASGPIVLNFRLVQDPKQALTFDYVDSAYYIDHK